MSKHAWLAIGLFLTGVTSAGAVSTAGQLTVLCAGGPATVYVTPAAKLGPNELGEEVSRKAFSARYKRGSAPAQLNVAPGEYMVVVELNTGFSMRDAMQEARGFVWDGFDAHAVVAHPETGLWRYAHCFRVTKEADQPLCVFAVFAKQTEAEQCAVFSPQGGLKVKFAGSEEEGLRQLQAGEVPSAFQDDLLTAASSGHKTILDTGTARWIVTVQRPDFLLVQQARGHSTWSGHRLSVVTAD